MTSNLLPLKNMDDAFKIFVEQLRDGREKKLNEVLDPSFIEIHEADLDFQAPVELEGEAYLAEHELVIHWNIKTEALIPCSICNESVKVPIKIRNFYYSEPLSEIKTGVYHFKDLLREIIVLEAPSFVECNQGQCPKRKDYRQLIKDPSSQDENQDEGYQPFANLDWKN